MLHGLQEAKRLGLPEPALLIVSANRAPHLADSHNDVDPTILHSLAYTDFWTAFEGRYGTNQDLVAAYKLLLVKPVNITPALRWRYDSYCACIMQMDHKVKQMVWPLLQADFKLLETYQVLHQTIPEDLVCELTQHRCP